MQITETIMPQPGSSVVGRRRRRGSVAAGARGGDPRSGVRGGRAVIVTVRTFKQVPQLQAGVGVGRLGRQGPAEQRAGGGEERRRDVAGHQDAQGRLYVRGPGLQVKRRR